MISAILILCLVSLTPFPSLPLAIHYYSKFGFTEGFIVVALASNLKILIHYNLGRILKNKNLNFKNLEKKILRAKKKYKLIKTKDLLLIRLSNLFITRILNIFLGYINYPLRKTFVINNIAIVPWQFLYFYFATKVDLLSNILLNYGINFSIVRLLSILSITSLAFLIVRILVKLLKKFNFNNYIEKLIK